MILCSRNEYININPSRGFKYSKCFVLGRSVCTKKKEYTEVGQSSPSSLSLHRELRGGSANN